MIRFIDLRWQGTGYRFAFWNTSADAFLTISGAQAWDTLRELKGDIAADYGQHPSVMEAWMLRLVSLAPDWANVEPEPTDDDSDEQRGYVRPPGA